MKSILNIFQIWYREIGNIIRDKGIMIFILFVPLAYPLLYSYVYTNEVVRDVPVVVVNEDNSPPQPGDSAQNGRFARPENRSVRDKHGGGA